MGKTRDAFSKDKDFNEFCKDIDVDNVDDDEFSRKQFLDLYSDISTSLASDQDFMDLVADQWLTSIPEASQSQIDKLVDAIKQSL